MIVKYKDNDVWGYIDNVRQAASKDIDCHVMIKKYDDFQLTEEQDSASYMNGERLKENIVYSNKVFLTATEELKDIFEDESYGNCHQQNLIDGQKVIDQYSASMVMLYLNEHKEYDTLVLVTNQDCYLMNDKGQTIERLV